MARRLCIVTLLVMASVLIVTSGRAGEPAKGPTPHVIKLEAGGKDYVPVLSGPPETVTMHSGLVSLAPGKSVGKHSTKDNEEMLVILEGKGEYRIEGGPTLTAQAGEALYCPPNREHDMVNVGTGVLRYVYIVARAK